MLTGNAYYTGWQQCGDLVVPNAPVIQNNFTDWVFDHVLNPGCIFRVGAALADRICKHVKKVFERSDRLMQWCRLCDVYDSMESSEIIFFEWGTMN